jgi:hypothetical protein
MGNIEAIMNEEIHDKVISKDQDKLLRKINFTGKYIETIQKLSPDASTKGVNWLQGIVDYYCQRISTMLPSLKLFKSR